MIKTHHVPVETMAWSSKYDQFENKLSYRLWQILHQNGRAVLLLRNPFEAILSWWKHVIDGDSHQEKELDYDTEMVILEC